MWHPERYAQNIVILAQEKKLEQEASNSFVGCSNIILCYFATDIDGLLFWFMQAEQEVSSLTKELQTIEDELDAAESRLSSITEQLKEAEAQADESERLGLGHHVVASN